MTAENHAGADHPGPARHLEPGDVCVRVDGGDTRAVVSARVRGDPVGDRGGQHGAGRSAIGIGMTYALFGSWGLSRSRTTVAVLVSGCGTASSSWACRCWPWYSSRAAP